MDLNLNITIFAPQLIPTLLNQAIVHPKNTKFFKKVSDLLIQCTADSPFKEYVIRDAFNRIKRPFTPERKFALMAIMCNYLEAYGSEFSLDIYQYMSTYIKMGLEGIIQAEYIFYLC